MRYILVLFFLLIGVSVFSQVLENEQLLTHQVDSVLKVIQSLRNEGLRDDAQEQFDLLRKLTYQQTGNQTSLYGKVCFKEGQFLSNRGYYKEADSAFINAIEAQKVIQPLGHPSYINSLRYLSVLRTEMGAYEGAETCMLELIAIRKKLLPIHDPRLIASITELGSLYRKMGTYEKADSIFRDYTTQLLAVHDQVGLEYARLLSEMGDLYREMEDFERAEPAYKQARSFYSTKEQRESGDYIALLTGLADLYMEKGQSDSSKIYLAEAKELVATGIPFFRKVKYGPVLNGLARLYRTNEDYDEAEELYLDGIEGMENQAQQHFPDYANLHLELASLYYEKGDAPEAEKKYLKTLSLWNEIDGPRVPGYPRTRMELGALYFKEGKYDKARDQFQKSKEYWEATLGKNYPLYIINILDLARVAWVTGDYTQADGLYAAAALLGRGRLTKAVHYMSARELNKYMQKILDTQAEILSFVSQSPIHKLSSEACYDNALFYKGFLLNSSIQVRRIAMANAGSASVYQQLNATQRVLSKEYSKPFSQQKDVSLYEARADSLEGELICMVSAFESLLHPLSWQDISSNLKTDEAAVEFIRYRHYNRGFTDSIMYAALLLLPDSMPPQVIPLFEEDKLSFVFLKPGKTRDYEYVKNMYTFDTRGLVLVRSGPPRATLHELIWNKIQEAGLPGVNTIYCSPSGVLHRINLDAISISEDSLISDRYRLVTIGSTRELLQLNENRAVQDIDSTAAIFGGIRFDFQPQETIQVDQNPEDSTAVLVLDDTDVMDRSTVAEFWRYLNGTELEAHTLEEICVRQGIEETLYQGFEATEEVFKELGNIGSPPSPWLLHMGTHGFFYPDPKLEESDHLLERRVIFKISDQPMLRSGIILAGANYSWQQNFIPPGMKEDGVLTAEEISHLDLSSTELVVLSACETGLGDLQGNEGVYGLQRAFKIAGARHLMMSLWKIPDVESKIFMEKFYQNWLVAKLSVRDAFHLTQQQMKSQYSKYSWAGFVLLE